jgi:hypothetical protein
MTNHECTAGQVVRYARPEAGEEALRFVVVEVRGDRVLIELLNFQDGRFAPQEVVAVEAIEGVER